MKTFKRFVKQSGDFFFLHYILSKFSSSVLIHQRPKRKTNSIVEKNKLEKSYLKYNKISNDKNHLLYIVSVWCCRDDERRHIFADRNCILTVAWFPSHMRNVCFLFPPSFTTKLVYREKSDWIRLNHVWQETSQIHWIAKPFHSDVTPFEFLLFPNCILSVLCIATQSLFVRAEKRYILHSPDLEYLPKRW